MRIIKKIALALASTKERIEDYFVDIIIRSVKLYRLIRYGSPRKKQIFFRSKMRDLCLFTYRTIKSAVCITPFIILMWWFIYCAFEYGDEPFPIRTSFKDSLSLLGDIIRCLPAILKDMFNAVRH